MEIYGMFWISVKKLKIPVTEWKRIISIFALYAIIKITL